jgi:hypothetical protein
MADRLLEGQLELRLRSLYTESGSWEEVSRRLLVEHAIQVSGQTLRQWAKRLGIGVAA